MLKRINTILDFARVRSQKPLWTLTVLAVTMLVTATLALCQEKTGIESVTKHYRVDKNVADFPKELDDLSKPENAYVLFSRAMCAPDSEDFSQNLDKLHIPLYRGNKSKPVKGDFAKILLSAQVLETDIFKNEKAWVIAKLEGKDVRNPFDIRYFENHEGKWLNTGNDRFDSVEDAQKKWDRIKYMKKMEDSGKPTTSIKDSLKTKLAESYRVDKKIADFPEKFDLSAPENAYVTQKHLIITNRKDKLEQLVKMNYYPGEIPERERRGIEKEIDAYQQKTYKEKFVVYEVIKFSDDLAFVFALRQFDKLYDGNMFQKKDDGLWYNLGNFQKRIADEIAGDVDQAVKRILQSDTSKQAQQETPVEPEIDSNRVPKIVKMFPENGAKNVDPNISQVYLTFDIPMGDGRAWAQRDNNTALDHDKENGPVFWTANKLTCVAPVVLKPNKKYEILLNFKPFIGFASLAGVPSEGVFYTFETSSDPIDPKKREKLAKTLFEKPKP